MMLERTTCDEIWRRGEQDYQPSQANRHRVAEHKKKSGMTSDSNRDFSSLIYQTTNDYHFTTICSPHFRVVFFHLTKSFVSLAQEEINWNFDDAKSFSFINSFECVVFEAPPPRGVLQIN